MNPNLKRVLALVKVNDPSIMDDFSDVLINSFFSLDVTKSVGSANEVSITDFPTYEGITKIDQIVLRPGTLSLQGLIGNHSFGGYRGKVGIERVRALLDHLLKRAYLLTVYTEDKTYENYVLRNVSVGRPQLETIDVNLQLREVFVFKESLIRIPITSSGQVITPGSGEIPTDNVKLIAEALKPRIVAEISKLPDVDFENALYTANVQILNLAMSYGLANITALGSNLVPVGPSVEREMKKSEFDSWVYRDRVVKLGTVQRSTGLFGLGDKVTYQRYRYYVWFRQPWQIGPWDSDVNGSKLNGFQFTVNETTIDGIVLKNKIVDYTEAQIINGRVNRWSFKGNLKDKQTNISTAWSISIDEGRLADSQIKASSLIVPMGTGQWRFRNSQTPKAWLYQAAWTIVDGQNRGLGLSLICIHPELWEVIHSAYRENWKVQWGTLL